jgi:hypothetical protein
MKMMKVLSRELNPSLPDNLFRHNIKPVIVDTDAAQTEDTTMPALGCPAQCGDPRISERNSRLGGWADLALQLGASFNHKDGIGTTDRGGDAKCNLGDATTAVESQEDIDARIDGEALNELKDARDHINMEHAPDYIGLDIRYSGNLCVVPNTSCIETFGSVDQYQVDFLYSLTTTRQQMEALRSNTAGRSLTYLRPLRAPSKCSSHTALVFGGRS